MDNRILYGIMTIVFNSVGVPLFMQGKVGPGIIRIVLGMVTCGVIAIINAIKGIILGIKILSMSDEEYQANKENLLAGIPSGK